MSTKPSLRARSEVVCDEMDHEAVKTGLEGHKD